MRGKIFNIQRYSIHDGPGIRTSVFLSSCNLRCLWCCNPESFLDGERWNREADAGDLMEEILEDKPYFKNSNGGVSLSGGEPLLQPVFVRSLLEECKRRGIDTAIETCGDVSWETFESISGLVDHYLYDVKHLNNERHKTFTGVDNIRILDNLRRLSKRGERVYLRVPLIPEYNMDAEEAAGIGELARDISAVEVHLLPYHRLGEKKYAQLGLKYPLIGVKDPMSYGAGRRMVEEFASIVRHYTTNLYVGG